MRILVDILHPHEVHVFRYAYEEWRKRGHEVALTAREKDVAVELLQNMAIPHTVLSRVGKGLAGLGLELIQRDWRLWRFCREFKPDVFTGVSGISAAHVAWLMRKPCVVWDDTEHQIKAHQITYPVATIYECPDCYYKPMGAKQYFYPGTQELAYLHPNRFTPDPDLVRSLGVDPDEAYCVIRLVSWGAHHDVGQHGIRDAVAFIKRIAQHARPLITSETTLPEELEPYRMRAPVHLFHHVLAFARACVAEGSTVAAEACVLGTPSVYMNTLRLGYMNLLQQYGLLEQTLDSDEALGHVLRWLTDDAHRAACQRAREKLLNDKMDVTEHIVSVVEHAGRAGRAFRPEHAVAPHVENKPIVLDR